MKNKLLLTSALLALAVTHSNAAVVYNIASFNNDGSSGGDGDPQWKAGISSITTAAGYTGTTDAELLSSQIIQTSQPVNFASNVARFSNQTGSDAAFGTVLTDPKGPNTVSGAPVYFQFGITTTGDNFDFTSLSFQALRATTGTTVRGYNIDVSIDGGTFVDFDDHDVANNRNDGLEAFSINGVGATYENISSIDFRVYSTGGANQYTNFAIDAIAVPEPSSTALLGLGGLALILRRRK